MIRLSLTRADASVTETETLTAGRVGLECAFTFNADWDGLEKVAVFEGAETIEVALGTANVAVVPPACMATAGYNLRCGAYGMSATQAIVIPTVWAKAGKIKDSAAPDESLADFTPTLAAQVIAKADSAEETANTIAERASRGEFDGFSPYVGVTEIENGHRVSITDSVGTNEFNVMDGADGANGDSPTIAVSDITGGHVLTITDINGTRTVNVLNGEDGAAGADGYSPTVTVTDITGGHRVTITDLNGNHTFDVMDGEDGEGGSSITVDSALSNSSTNPVQNKVIKAALDGKGTYSKPNGGIPESDFAEDVQNSLDALNKNLIGQTLFSGQSRVVNGITFTDNGDGTVTANGTATAAATFRLRGWTIDDGAIPIDPNVSYRLTGSPVGAATTTYFVACRSYTASQTPSSTTGTVRRDVGDGVTFTGATYVSIYVGVISGQTVNNLVFQPMLSYAGVDDSTFAESGESVIPYLAESVNNKIAAPSSPTSGQFLVYNGSAWVAQTLATWQASSY